MKRKKKIAIIGTAGVPGRYGGFETLAHHLVLQMASQYDIHVYASKKTYARDERKKYWKGARIHYLPFSANGVSSVLYDILSMIHALFYADRMIILGVSGGIFVPVVKLLSRAKVIVNIDGLEWRRNKWNSWAKRFLKFSEKVAVRYSDADITDNEAIKRYTAIHYRTASHLIAYGADHVKPQDYDRAEREKYAFLGKPYAFKVARIEPENNIELILGAFAGLPSKRLVVVGNWQNSDYGKQLKAIYDAYPNLFLLDPIYEQDELDKLRSNCFVYIHGHSAGGTNPSLVEAMYLGLPVMAFDVSYNRATMQNEGIYYRSQRELVDHLQSASYSKLVETAAQLKKVAQAKYTWKYIANRYAGLIEAFDYAYKKPSLRKDRIRLSDKALQTKGYAHLANTKMFFE